VYDDRRLREHSHIVHAEKVRLKKLVQNATFSFDATTVPTEVFEEVVASYKPMCIAADAGSVVAQKEIRRLHHFVAQDFMHIFLWDYVTRFMQRWNKYSPQEFCFIVQEIFDPLVIMGKYCTPKPEVVNRIEDFLSLHQVIELKALMAPHAAASGRESDELIRALLQQDPKRKRKASPDFGAQSSKQAGHRPGTSSSHAGSEAAMPNGESHRHDDEASESDLSSDDEPMQSDSLSVSMQAFDDMTIAERHRNPVTASEVFKLYKIEENTTYKWEQVYNKGGIKCEKAQFSRM
jgi:hypothetical protein